VLRSRRLEADTEHFADQTEGTPLYEYLEACRCVFIAAQNRREYYRSTDQGAGALF
jgi:uncharacterized protein YqjF (DUF2071 family)